MRRNRKRFARYRTYLWEAIFVGGVGTPIVMALKDVYPWIMAVTIFAGAAAIVGLDYFAGAVRVEEPEHQPAPTAQQR